MQRRFWKEARKAGVEATVSALALMSRLPILASFAHEGTRPQR